MKYRVDFKIVDGDRVICALSAGGSTIEEAVSSAMAAAGPHFVIPGRSAQVLRAGFYCDQCKVYHGFDELKPIHVEVEALKSGVKGWPGN
jgi:hypothetical protein